MLLHDVLQPLLLLHSRLILQFIRSLMHSFGLFLAEGLVLLRHIGLVTFAQRGWNLLSRPRPFQLRGDYFLRGASYVSTFVLDEVTLVRTSQIEL